MSGLLSSDGAVLSSVENRKPGQRQIRRKCRECRGEVEEV